MKKKLLLTCISVIVLSLAGIIIYKINLFQCKNLLSLIENEEGWQELPCGLWINKNGDIGLKTTKAISEEEIIDFYLTQTPIGDDVPLKMLVDTATFHYMGGSFYKDKNHIYNYFPMSDGGNFYPIDDRVDYSTFEILENGCYARDKNHIYVEKHIDIIDEVDYETFRAIDGCIGQDKNGYFLWTDRITEDEAKEYLKILE